MRTDKELRDEIALRLYNKFHAPASSVESMKGWAEPFRRWAGELIDLVRESECRHQGAVDIVTLLGPGGSNKGVPAAGGLEVGVRQGTCPECGARVVTTYAYDSTQPWSPVDGHGGTDRQTGWTPWLSHGGQVVQDPSWSPVEVDQAAALAADRTRVAAEVAEWGDLLADACTCPPPAAGGVAGVNRGHLLGCPELAGGK